MPTVNQIKEINAADALKSAQASGWNPVSIIISKKLFYIEPGIVKPYDWETLVYSGNPNQLTAADFEGKVSKPFPSDAD